LAVDAASVDEWSAKQALAGAGIARPQGRLVHGVAAAIEAAEALGYPVVVKAADATLAHKTELGGVALRLADAAAVAAAVRRMAHLGETFLVEPMIQDGVVELIVGVVRDPQLGLHLVVGAGGIDVELIADRKVLLLPTGAREVRDALLGLRIAPKLAGWRGRPAADVPAAVEAILAVARLAEAHADRLLELEVNPLIVRPVGLGAVAVDALLRLAPGDAADAA
jgi:succinyl-CoA synthetase beta subunit